MSEKNWRELAKLGHNWDGYGAKPLDPSMIFTAKKLFGKLSDFSEPHVVPGSSGSIQFEWWDIHNDKFLDLEIEDLQTVHYLRGETSEGFEEEDIIPIEDIKEIIELVSWVHG